MKIVVGLGNPGEKYANNRHNVGFMAVDRFAGIRGQESGMGWESKFEALIQKSGDLMLVKPQGFMNNSGEVVREIVNFYKVSTADLWVIHDDLDLPLGAYKIQVGIGPKVHNGVNSIEQALGKNDFWRVRVGIDNRIQNSEFRIPGEEYVLADFDQEEKKIIEGVIEKVVAQLVTEHNFR